MTISHAAKHRGTRTSRLSPQHSTGAARQDFGAPQHRPRERHRLPAPAAVSRVCKAPSDLGAGMPDLSAEDELEPHTKPARSAAGSVVAAPKDADTLQRVRGRRISQAMALLSSLALFRNFPPQENRPFE